jgi:hypothetical protein
MHMNSTLLRMAISARLKCSSVPWVSSVTALSLLLIYLTLLSQLHSVELGDYWDECDRELSRPI